MLSLGCQHTFKETKIGEGPTPILRNDTRVYIARPPDAVYKKTVAQNSGKHVAAALLDAFSRNTKGAFMGKNPESVTEALETARRINAKYVVYPHILRWEDHLTEFTGIRDKLELRIELLDVEGGGGVVYAKEIEAKSRWMTDGGDTPQDLIGEPVDHFVALLFRTIEAPTSLR
jgi:hypothetical protein